MDGDFNDFRAHDARRENARAYDFEQSFDVNNCVVNEQWGVALAFLLLYGHIGCMYNKLMFIAILNKIQFLFTAPRFIFLYFI